MILVFRFCFFLSFDCGVDCDFLSDFQHHQALLAAYSIASETATINHHHPHLPAAVAAAHLQHQQLQHHLNKQQVQSHHQALLAAAAAANPITGNPSAALAVIAAAKSVNSQPQQVIHMKMHRMQREREKKLDEKFGE